MAENEEQDLNKDSPEQSPMQFSNSKTLSSVPLKIVLFVVGITIAAIVYILFDAEGRSAIDADSNKKKSVADNNMYYEEVVKNMDAGIVENKVLEVPSDDIAMIGENAPKSKEPHKAPERLKPMDTTAPLDFDRPPIPTQMARIEPQIDQELQQIKAQKIQMFTTAMTAKTKVNSDVKLTRSNSPFSNNPNTSANESNEQLEQMRANLEQIKSQDPNKGYQKELLALQSKNGFKLNATSNSSSQGSSKGINSNNYGAFDGTESRWNLDSTMQTPVTYQVSTGSVIPATLITGVNSDIPGQLIAQVSRNIFDTATGNYLLIPQGTRLIGSYSSEINYGQERVMVAWQRLIFPDGKLFDIGNMTGVDQSGYSGLSDQVNNHYWKIFSSAFLLSAITAGISYSQDRNNNNDRITASSAMSESMGQQLGQTTAKMLDKNINIAPTLEIRPGFRLNVVVTKDLKFTKAYSNYDY